MRCFFLGITLVVMFGFISSLHAGYGDTLGGYPNWQERAITTLTNACRMDPVAYRNKYVGNYSTILLPANYPAVSPVYLNQPLNRAARAHAIDMANNCGLQHNSCNGESTFVRIKRYYTASGTLAENIATGNADPVATMNQWILDKTSSTGPPAADKSGYDGHRRNIMNSAYRDLGCGYAYGTVQWNHFWVQDFGGGPSVFTNRIYSGTHLFLKTDSITFMANYYDGANAPTSMSVYLGGVKHNLTKDLNGTYTVTLPKAASCRSYYFSFTSSAATVYRFPEQGYLVTFKEGTCLTDYTVSALVRNRAQDGRKISGFGIARNGMIFGDNNAGIAKIARMSVDGRIHSDARSVQPGIKLVRVRFKDGSVVQGKMLVVR